MWHWHHAAAQCSVSLEEADETLPTRHGPSRTCWSLNRGRTGSFWRRRQHTCLISSLYYSQLCTLATFLFRFALWVWLSAVRDSCPLEGNVRLLLLLAPLVGLLLTLPDDSITKKISSDRRWCKHLAHGISLLVEARLHDVLKCKVLGVLI